MKFEGCLLVWPTARATRNFNVRVVEPQVFDPIQNGEIFRAAVMALSTTGYAFLTPGDAGASVQYLPTIDLITFPEAFLLPTDLIEVLSALQTSGRSDWPCMHVGLRSSADLQEHLFSVEALHDLLDQLQALKPVDTDIHPFRAWLAKQAKEHYFNVGCLFTWDKDQQLRLCLQPKMIRSKYENGPDPKQRMTEGNLLTLVTLLPLNRALTSVTIQPLLCSDVLALSTDTPDARPLEAVNRDAECFADFPPDHIDIVSLGTQTPRGERQSGSHTRPAWHQDFLETLRRAADEDVFARHRHATFVLANFAQLRDGDLGGLSGAFIPCPMGTKESLPFVTYHCYGRLRDKPKLDNNWYFPADQEEFGKGWSSRGYFAYLEPPAGATAYMLEFTIHRLLRDASRWRSPDGLVAFKLHQAKRDPPDRHLAFYPWRKS